MPDNRRARRERDPGLQPERTSLAWFRTLLGYGAGIAFWISLCILPFAALILWRYTRSRNLMNVEQSDFAQPQAVRDKFLIAFAVLSLSLLFAVTHIRQVILFIKDMT